jgi:hypothetical protein
VNDFYQHGVTFRNGLATEKNWLQSLLVLTVHYRPAPVSAGGFSMIGNFIEVLCAFDRLFLELHRFICNHNVFV